MNNNILTIREVKLSDLKNIQKVHNEVIQWSKQFDPVIDINYSYSKKGIKYLIKSIENKNIFKVVAEIDNKIIGYLFGGKFTYDYRKVIYGEIQDMGVISKYRGKGIGTKLVEEFKKWCVKKGYNWLYVNTYVEDTKAVNFYKKQGLTPSDIVLVGKI